MGNGKHMSASERSSCNSCGPMISTRFDKVMGRKELREFIIYKYGTHTRTATTMRYGEGFMKVQMADISTNMSGIRESDLRIHICSIHVYKSSICMDNI